MDRDAPLTEVERWSIFQRIEEVLAEVGFGRQVHRLCRPAYSQRADGRLFNVVWKNGYSDWDVGDTVILSVDPGFGFMVYGNRQTQVWVEETGEAVPDNGDRASILVPRTLTPGASISVPQLNR